MVFIRKKLVEDDNIPNINSLMNTGSDQNTDQNISQDDSIETNDSIDDLSDLSDMEISEEKQYNWHDILEILSEYVNPEVIQQIEDDWNFNYPNGLMDNESVDDLLSDIAVSFNEELASEIKSRIEQLQDPKVIKALDLSTDIGVLQDALDKIQDLEIKEKLVNLIDSLK